MIRFALVQYMWVEFLGTMYLSAVLKKAGHNCQVFIGRDKEIVRKTRFFNPDVIAFSIFTSQHRWAMNLARMIKDDIGSEKFIIMGGRTSNILPRSYQK